MSVFMPFTSECNTWVDSLSMVIFYSGFLSCDCFGR